MCARSDRAARAEEWAGVAARSLNEGVRGPRPLCWRRRTGVKVKFLQPSKNAVQRKANDTLRVQATASDQERPPVARIGGPKDLHRMPDPVGRLTERLEIEGH
jgi:hypothetical protein